MRSKYKCRALLAGLLVVLTAGPAHAAINASTADDVCEPAEDPCVVTQTVIIEFGSTLDFGLRTLNVTGGGKFDFEDGSATILAGNINISVSGTGLKVRKSVAGEFIGGDATISARRACSGDDVTPCLFDSGCANLGLGTCSAGPEGTLIIDGKIQGTGKFEPAFVSLDSAGDMTIKRPIEMSATGADADSGFLEITSSKGSVTIEKLVDLKGGSASTGGDIDIFADLDITLMDVVTAASTNGEDAEGGVITIEAGRDVFIHDDINANGGSFQGGDIAIDAFRDVMVDGVSGNRANISVSAQTFFDEFGEAFGGDGGFLDITAGRNLNFGQFSRLEGDGAAPEGEGGELGVFSDGGDITFGGDFFSRGLGSFGGGGNIEMDAFQTLTLGATAKIDVTAGDAGAGAVELLSSNDIVTQSGSLIDASAGGIGFGGSVEIDGTGITLGGEIDASGTPIVTFNGIIDIDGCEVEVLGTSEIKNNGGSGSTIIAGRGLVEPNPIIVRTGSLFSATGGNGLNRIEYLDAGFPPIIELSADFDPPADEIVNQVLVHCPACGNVLLDAGETCDDGNFANGDGCSSDCQLESCIAQSIDYPAQPLCNDDNDCTDDTCNTTTGNCDHVIDCNDGVPCTVDQCVGTSCTHTPDHGSCDDTSPCTDDTCDLVAGCVSTNNSAPCADGMFCNGNDTCQNGACSLHDGDPCSGAPECGSSVCNEGGDTCEFVVAGTACTDDGNICTDDQCDGAGNCAHVPNSASCDDGDACTIDDTCNGGVCEGTPQGGCSDVCGDGAVSGAEECDNGTDNGVVGNACSATCTWVLCGRPTGGDDATATDSLFVLEAGVGARVCDLCICDVTGDGQTNSSDALSVIRNAVGIPVPFSCPACF